MGNALDTSTGSPAAHLHNLCSQLQLTAGPARCVICNATLEGDEDEAATAAFYARWQAAYRTPALPASHYTPGMRVHLWDSGCLAVVVDSSHLGDGMIQVDDLHIDEFTGQPIRGMVYRAGELRPATEVA